MDIRQGLALEKMSEYLSLDIPCSSDNTSHESIWHECRNLAHYVVGIMLDIEAGKYTHETAITDLGYWYDDVGNGLAHSLDQYAREIDNEEETD